MPLLNVTTPVPLAATAAPPLKLAAFAVAITFVPWRISMLPPLTAKEYVPGATLATVTAVTEAAAGLPLGSVAPALSPEVAGTDGPPMSLEPTRLVADVPPTATERLP